MLINNDPKTRLARRAVRQEDVGARWVYTCTIVAGAVGSRGLWRTTSVICLHVVRLHREQRCAGQMGRGRLEGRSPSLEVDRGGPRLLNPWVFLFSDNHRVSRHSEKTEPEK